MNQRLIRIAARAGTSAVLVAAALSVGAFAAQAQVASTTAPTATGGNITVMENGTATGTLSGVDTNTPALPITFTIVGNPTSGTLSNVGTSSGAFTYTPTTGFSGSDHFTFSVGNGAATSSAATELITVTPATSTPTTTAYLTLGNYSGMPGTQVLASGTGFSNNESVTIAFGGTNTTTTTNGMGVFSTNVTVPNVTSGSISITATGVTSGQAASNTFFVEPASSTSTTTTSADLTALENEITALEQQLVALVNQLQALISGQGGGTNTGGGTTTGSAMITPQGATVNAGGSIDFGGSGFNHEEDVTVMQNGAVVGHAHADGGGNFSTGSISIPTTPGTYVYTFTGARGDSATDTIVVH